MDSNNFPLPNLREKLQHLAEDVHNGKGFFVLRGPEPTRYSVEDSTVIFLGIQSYIAEQRLRQDSRGNMIGKNCDSLPLYGVNKESSVQFTSYPILGLLLRAGYRITSDIPIRPL